MAEYIDKELVIDAIDVLKSTIEIFPTKDFAPVKHGKWCEQYGIFHCSECEYSFKPEGYLPFFNYCPCCGARMDGGDPNDQM